ncbi:unnamed protein product [Spodoptera littoralis]|uniref:PH domain-containing protein n=1 Tax=Spodoptera littoralis TaxID=7109 RepID=A0A9P0IJM8_SPOLI|nr:unnamed protein product [Spodoptera littoralis]CAH1646250.1 unnamed protein product [Spodoptera littoralis]
MVIHSGFKTVSVSTVIVLRRGRRRFGLNLSSLLNVSKECCVLLGFADDLVTRRQKKDAQLGEEERAMRRVSYLKATWGDRLHLDSDVEPENDPQGLRGTTKKGEEEIAENAVDGEATEGDVQGNVQIKMVVSNGKRASDRSWKQVWAVLHGTKLYLYRHHPSQVCNKIIKGNLPCKKPSASISQGNFTMTISKRGRKNPFIVRPNTCDVMEASAEGSICMRPWSSLRSMTYTSLKVYLFAGQQCTVCTCARADKRI